MWAGKFFLCFVAILCVMASANNSTDPTTSSAPPIPSTTTISHQLLCSRDYHCPSKCDTCIHGVCTHKKGAKCSRDYHCNSCQTCYFGQCVSAEHRKKCSVTADCDPGMWCYHSLCTDNVCNQVEDCGPGQVAVCKEGACHLV
ncbi:hypothetical protein L5515_003966 [Caenorhabditis briggsae]|uniref:Uncharacterized protein n=1 Tax=Caenorhabditis briggsae TaxID=6238 RepID=A0AAE9EK09_CAEBR|nr:hypothetical protein L5515_003966 [Caenorhabditis briggsae]